MADLSPYSPAVRLRRTMTDDPYSGSQTLGSWQDAAEANLEGALFASGTTAEFPNVDIEELSALGTLYLPLGADVTAADRVRVDGALWDVVGRRGDWQGAGVSGSVVTLRWVREES